MATSQLPPPGVNLPAGTTLDSLIYAGLISNPPQLIVSAGYGTIIKAMVLSSIWMMTASYYRYFNKSDPLWMRICIGLGTALATAELGIQLSQMHKLIYFAYTDYASIMPFDVMASFTSMAIFLIFHVTTSAFYAWRAWKLSNRNRYLAVPLGLAVLSIPACSIPSLVYGFKFPTYIAWSDILELGAWSKRLEHYMPVWLYGCLVCDGTICVIMLYYLVRSKQSIFQGSKRVFNKVLTLIMETMLPPVLILLALAILQNRPASILSDFRRGFVATIQTVYYMSLLHSLTTRRTVKDIMDDSLASNGVQKFSYHERQQQNQMAADYPHLGFKSAENLPMSPISARKVSTFSNRPQPPPLEHFELTPSLRSEKSQTHLLKVEEQPNAM